MRQPSWKECAQAEAALRAEYVARAERAERQLAECRRALRHIINSSPNFDYLASNLGGSDGR